MYYNKEAKCLRFPWDVAKEMEVGGLLRVMMMNRLTKTVKIVSPLLLVARVYLLGM